MKKYLMILTAMICFGISANAQLFGYLKVINANEVKSMSDNHYVITSINIKTTESQEWSDKNYCGGSIGEGYADGNYKSTSIALKSDLYDIRVGLSYRYWDPRSGEMSGTKTVESFNVPIRNNMTTEITMKSGNLYVSQPQ